MAFDYLEGAVLPDKASERELAQTSIHESGSAAKFTAVLASAGLSACGGGGGGGTGASDVPAVVVPGRSIGLDAMTYTYRSASSDADAARFLLQAQFSASDTDIAAVRSLGYATWLERQVAANVGGTGWDWLNAKGYGNVSDPANYFDSASPGDYMAWSQLIGAPDALRKRAALALSEFFVVSLNGLDFSWRSHAIAHYWDTLNTHALATTAICCKPSRSM